MENPDYDPRSDSSSASIDNALEKINFEKALYKAETTSSALDDDLLSPEDDHECQLYT